MRDARRTAPGDPQAAHMLFPKTFAKIVDKL
jgi:hypothetical protein